MSPTALAKPTRAQARTLVALETQGFDRSHISCGTVGCVIYVKCSQCEALVVCGVATHEHGCPNATHECRGCNAQIPIRQRYCEECR